MTTDAHARSGSEVAAEPRAPAVAASPSDAWPRWAWCALTLLFCWRVSIGLGNLGWVTLTPLALTPLVAAWLAWRFGPAVVVPLLLLVLLPDWSWQTSLANLSWEPPPLHLLLVGVGAGALLAMRHQDERWQGIALPRRWRAWLPLAVALALLGIAQWPARPISAPGEPFLIHLDLVGALAAGVALVAFPWRNLRAHAQRSPGNAAGLGAWLLPSALLLWALLHVSWNVSILGPAWGSAYARSWVWGLLAVGAATAVPARRWWWIALGVVAAVEGLTMLTGAPRLHMLWVDPERLYLSMAPKRGFIDLVMVGAGALLVATAFAETVKVHGRRAAPHTHSQWLWYAVLGAATVLVAIPATQPAFTFNTAFSSIDPRAWVVGGAVLLIVWRLGPWALLFAPLAMASGAFLGEAWLAGFHPEHGLVMHACGTAALAASYGFVGWLLHRRDRAEARATDTSDAANRIDIGRLAHFVHRLDVSYTLRSFGVLLVLLGVLYALVQTGVTATAAQLALVAESGDWSMDATGVALIVALAGTLAALVPLSFLIADAMQRQDRWRPLIGLSGAATAALGHLSLGLLWCGLMMAVLYLLNEVEASVVIGGVVTVALTAMMLLGALTQRPRWHAGIAVFSGLGVVFMLLATVWWIPAETDDTEPVPMWLIYLAQLAALGVFTALVWRSVRLRADLALPIPRPWLLGEIPGGGFWKRLASLAGLPASMWRADALREAAFWPLLLARPLVYAGGGLLAGKHWWAGPLVVLLGHGCFVVGKRLAARRIWRARRPGARPPVLFLRSFEDDQFDFRIAGHNPIRHWLAFWSFRRNLDETLVDEAAAYGPVVALGRPGERERPFGAERHYSTHDDWQAVILDTARRARAIVIAAGSTPGVLWEYDMLRREGLLPRTLLVFPPHQAQSHQAALQAFAPEVHARADVIASDPATWIALLMNGPRPVLLTAQDRSPSAYLLALRLHLQGGDPAAALPAAARLAPKPPRWVIT